MPFFVIFQTLYVSFNPVIFEDGEGGPGEAGADFGVGEGEGAGEFAQARGRQGEAGTQDVAEGGCEECEGIGDAFGVLGAQLARNARGELAVGGAVAVTDIVDAALLRHKRDDIGDVPGHEQALAGAASGNVEVKAFADAADHRAEVARGIRTGHERRAKDGERHAPLGAPEPQKFLGHDVALGIGRSALKGVLLAYILAFLATVDRHSAYEYQRLGHPDLFERAAEIDGALIVHVEKRLRVLMVSRLHVRQPGGVENHVVTPGKYRLGSSQVYRNVVSVGQAEGSHGAVDFAELRESVSSEKTGRAGEEECHWFL